MSGWTAHQAAVTLAAPDHGAAVAAYSRLFGPGSAMAPAEHQWQVGSTRLVVRASAVDGEDRPRILIPVRDLVDPATPDVYTTVVTLLERRSCVLRPDAQIGDARTGVVEGLPVGVVDAAALPRLPSGDATEIGALDHVVVNSPSRDAALALFGAVLGFDFRLEQRMSLPNLGDVHQLFLRGAGTIVEVLVNEAGDPAISLWGLAWTSADIDASHARLAGAGTDLSPIRNGHKRGTRVFTVRDDALILPTIVIGHDET
ncbi:hypothetical protein GOARA_036_01290 [Gordonia araii NBRC 100433]|uniref:VOC domain-containing protein n=1 Tax=Gordonia araii NBRC 100433 TaxID=1073574 RepID=G7H0M2_9ACTN|nr:VOC family protein [Gordonia araii]NNG96840.1 hypothetical protein [Gordonia araii NBRC 100433]GAB09397.1 hypothetical protein GOARA_036_01290 [Gordonia araii NBRC 100433]